MERCTTALSASSQQRVCAPVFSSEVHRDGLDGLSMMSSLRSGPRNVGSKRGCAVVHNVSRGKSGYGLVPAMPIFKMNAAVGDSSSSFPVRTAPRGNKLQKIILQEKTARFSGSEMRWQAELPRKKSLSFSNFRLFLPFLRMINNLRRYGVAGLLSYGLLNTAYYLGTFLFVWFYVAPSPGGLGFVPAAQRFLKVFATVWAGSQVTKLIRAAGALSLAPFIDRGLNWYAQRFNFESRATAFSFLVGACFGLAVLVFLVITTMWS